MGVKKNLTGTYALVMQPQKISTNKNRPIFNNSRVLFNPKPQIVDALEMLWQLFHRKKMWNANEARLWIRYSDYAVAKSYEDMRKNKKKQKAESRGKERRELGTTEEFTQLKIKQLTDNNTLTMELDQYPETHGRYEKEI